MATCIRCGKPCADGETMCDDCKAWFREKTGGAVPGANKAAAQAKNTIQASAPASEKSNADASARKEKAVKPERNTKPLNLKVVGIAGGAVAAVVLIVVIVFVAFGNMRQEEDVSANVVTADIGEAVEHVDQTDALESDAEDEVNRGEEQQEEQTEGLEETNQETEGEDTPGKETVNMDAQVVPLQDLYNNQIQSYSNSSAFESFALDECSLYYVSDELVEIDVENTAGAAGYHREYYFNDGSLYYAKIYKNSGSSNELYFDDEILIRWIDADHVKHDGEYDSNAYNDWYEYQQEGYEYYSIYEDIQSVQKDEDDEYVLADSDKKYLTKSDLQGLSAWELKLARNEIYARHGRKFNDEQLQAYFNSCSWYKGTVKPDDFKISVFNAYEKANAEFIAAYEKQMGYT